MEKTLSALGNYLDSITSTTGRSVLDWLYSANPIVVLLLLAIIVVFFFTPMLRYYVNKAYWKFAMWRSRIMVRRYRRISVDAKIADAVVGVLEEAVLRDELTREDADKRYYDIGVCCGIVDLLPKKKPRKLDWFRQQFLKAAIRDKIPDVDSKLEALRASNIGNPPKLPRRRTLVVE